MLVAKRIDRGINSCVTAPIPVTPILFSMLIAIAIVTAKAISIALYGHSHSYGEP